jgi:hypothetical protein
MRKIYHVSYCGEYGEADGFFDETGKLLHWFHGNDALWRNEYMDPLLLELGIEVHDGNKKFRKKLEKELKEINEA